MLPPKVIQLTDAVDQGDIHKILTKCLNPVPDRLLKLRRNRLYSILVIFRVEQFAAEPCDLFRHFPSRSRFHHYTNKRFDWARIGSTR